MNIIKKISLLLFFVGILFLPNITKGQSNNLGLISEIINSLNGITGQVLRLENEISNVKKEISSVMGFVGNIYLPNQNPSTIISPESFLISRNMSLGSRGQEVRQLQECLKNAGLFPNNQNITEYYGKTTEEAIIKFQEREGIISQKDDGGRGKLGPKTRSLLARFCAKTPIIGSAGTSSTSTLPIGLIKYAYSSTSTLPDLISLNLNSSNPSSGKWDFTGTIFNIGNSASNIGQTKLRIDLLNDGTWDILPSNQPTNSIAPKSFEIEQWKNLTITSVGTHKYEICADDLNTTIELNELNNCGSSTFTISSSGALTASVDTVVPSEQQVILGSSLVTLAQFNFSANNTEDVRIDRLRITAKTSVGSPSTFINLQFYDGAVPVGPKGSALIATSTNFYMSDFSFGNSIIIPKNTTKTYILRGDLPTYLNSPNSHNKFYNFQINSADSSATLNGDLKAYGITSGIQVPVSSVPPSILEANTQNTLRTKLTPSMSVIGATSSRPRIVGDNIGLLTLSAAGSPADTGAEFKSVNFLFSGDAIPNSTNMRVSLVDSSNGSIIASVNIPTSIATSTGVVLTPSVPLLITKGLSKDLKLRVDSFIFANDPTKQDSLSWQLNSTSSLVWATQGNSSIESLGLEKGIVPMINTVYYQ